MSMRNSSSSSPAAAAAAVSAELEHALRLRYLDSPRERASLCILRELGVAVEAIAAAPTASASAPSTSAPTTATRRVPLDAKSPLLAEHVADGPVAYEVATGRVLVDVRDAGDAWIRMLLGPGQRLTLAPTASRRFVQDPTLPTPANAAVELLETPSTATLVPRPRFARAQDAEELIAYHSFRELICELCRQFYAAGWVTGTGGSISIRHGNRIYMTPSGVQKERIAPDELYMLDLDGAILDAPAPKPGRRLPKLSDCSPLFLHAYRLRGAGAVLHSHGITCNLITALCDGQREFRITHQEMIKGLAGHGYHDELVIPIIENTARESELADALADAIVRYPRASAVLVRRHGIYVWGDSWEAAKRHGECLHYLFETAIEMHKHGLDFGRPPPALANAAAAADGPKKRPRTVGSDDGHSRAIATPAEERQYVLLDIEGTTTPITFVKDVLFPFARDRVRAFLTETWATPQTRADVAALRAQAAVDLENGLTVPTIPAISGNGDDEAATPEVIAAIVAYVHHNIAADRKITALKQLQGHIWDLGYASGALRSLVYADVPVFLRRMAQRQVRVGIYSSGSRAAQRALFKYSDQGDLRPLLSVYFDTRVGHKRESASYEEIFQSLGLDAPSQVLFVTDVLEEAQAATAAGLHVALSVRPGNAPLPPDHGFREIRSFDEL